VKSNLRGPISALPASLTLSEGFGATAPLQLGSSTTTTPVPRDSVPTTKFQTSVSSFTRCVLLCGKGHIARLPPRQTILRASRTWTNWRVL